MTLRDSELTHEIDRELHDLLGPASVIPPTAFLSRLSANVRAEARLARRRMAWERWRPLAGLAAAILLVAGLPNAAILDAALEPGEVGDWLAAFDESESRFAALVGDAEEPATDEPTFEVLDETFRLMESVDGS